MASIELREEYLKMVGPLTGSATEVLSDAQWTAVIAYLFSDGFIKGLDWSTPAGLMFGNVLDNFFDSGKDRA
jgi:hypothetical protein